MKRNTIIGSLAIGISSAMAFGVLAMPNGKDNYMTREEAEAIAVQHAGLNEAEVRFVRGHLDYDNGRAEYDIEFWKDNKEYDYEIDAVTGAVLSYDYNIESYTIPTTQNSSGSANRQQANTGDYITDAEAKTIAVQHAGLNESEVQFVTSHLDYEHGRAEYEIEFWKDNREYDYEIDAVTGAVLGYDYDIESYVPAAQNASGNGAAATNGAGSYISEAEAKAIALQHANLKESSLTAIRCKLDYDDGRAEYELEFRQGRMEYEYTIDALTGNVLEYDMDYDD